MVFVLGKRFSLDSLLRVFVLGKRFLLDWLLRVFVLGKRFLLDSLLRVFVFGKSFLLDSLLRVFVLGKRFSLDSLLRVVVFDQISCWIHSSRISDGFAPQGFRFREKVPAGCSLKLFILWVVTLGSGSRRGR